MTSLTSSTLCIIVASFLLSLKVVSQVSPCSCVTEVARASEFTYAALQVSCCPSCRQHHTACVPFRIKDSSSCTKICIQAVLGQLERPLLCTSAHVEEQEQLEIPEAAMLMDLYAGQGLDFVVDSGQRVTAVLQLTKAACCLPQ